MSNEVSQDQIVSVCDVNIEKLELVGRFKADGNNYLALDIRPQIFRIDMYESIFEPFTTATFFVNDGGDLINNVPLRGEEIINFVGGTPSLNQNYLKFDKAFHINKILHREQSTDRTSTYMLHGISIEKFVDSNRKISRSFSGNVSEIAKDILTNDKYGLGIRKRFEIEETINSTHYISNFWTPTKNLQYLANTAISKEDSPTFVFFENRIGFNFLSLERIYQNDPVQVFVKDNFVSEGKMEITDRFSRIMMIETPDLFDYYENANKGLFGSNLHNYDMTLKRHTLKQYFSTADEGRVMLNKNLPYTTSLVKSSENIIMDTATQYAMFDDVADVSNTKILQTRKSRLASANYHSIKVMVPGRSDYTVGFTVNVVVPKDTFVNAGDDPRKNIDPLLSGKYIIAEINHSITMGGVKHVCTMNLIKDSEG